MPMLGGLSRPAIDAVLTMWPSYPGSFAAAASIIGVKTRTPWTTPMTLTPSTHSQSASVFSQTRPPAPTPALLKTMCGAPKRCATARPSASTSPALLTSTRCASTCAPRPWISAAARSSASACTSAMTTFMPRRAAMREVSRPKPEPAPVMTAVRPLNCFMEGPPDDLDVVPDAREVDVDGAGARVDALDDDLLGVEPHQRPGDL